MTVASALPRLLRHPAGPRQRAATRAIFLVAGLAIGAWAPLVPFAKDRLGVDDGTLGLLLLCLGLGSIVAMPVTGPLASRFGCRMVIVVASIGIAIAMPLLVLSASAWSMALSLALFGASVGTVDVAMNIQAVIVESDSGKSLMSGFHGLFSLGGILGAGGVSLLLGLAVTPLVCTLIMSAVVAAILVASTSGLLPYGNRDETRPPLFVLPRGIIVLIGLLCFLTFLAEGAVLDWSAIFLVTALAVDPSEAGFGYAMFAVAMTVGRLTGDLIVARFGGRRVVFAGGLVAAAGFALAVFAPGRTLALLGFLLVGLGASNIVPVLFTAAGRQEKMPPSLAVAAVTTLGYAGVLAGPAIIGFVAEHAGLGGGLLLLSASLLFVAATAPIAAR